jgi:FOG: TPR repeat, SEL1 subfamily
MKNEYAVDENYHDFLEAERRTNKPDASELGISSVKMELNAISGSNSIPVRFNVDIGSAHFECFFKEKESDWLYVFLPGARTGSKKLPRFSRWSWYPSVDGNVLCVEDPMYYKFPKLSIGWFFGTQDEDYTEYLLRIVEKIAEKHKIPNEHIVFYGSSAGGTTSIACSSSMNGSVAVSINPQFFPNITDARKKAFESTGMVLSDPQISDRVHLMEKMIRGKGKNIIIVNCASKDDFKDLLGWCKELKIEPKLGIVQAKNVLIWTYEAYGTPSPHTSFENLSIFKMASAIIKGVSACKNDVELAIFIEKNQNLISLINESWFMLYDVKKDLKMSQIDHMLKYSAPKYLDKAFELCMAFAEHDSGEAMGRLGRIYRDGKGTKQDVDEAIKCMRVATENVEWAKIELFDLLWKRGSDKDFEEAFVLISAHVADGGDGRAIGRLARAYREGKGVEKNTDTAIITMRKATQKNIGWAKNELFDLLWKRGSDKDFEEAFVLISAYVAERNDEEAAGRLARAYRDGKGVRKDSDKAIEYMRTPAENIGWANNELTDLLLERSNVGDVDEAYNVCLKFAEKGNTGAMGRLGRMYYHGIGVTKDVAKAIEWMKKAAEDKVVWGKELDKMLIDCSEKK